MTRSSAWDTELYEARHSFVWKMGEALLTALDPHVGERILDVGCGTGQLTNSIAASGATVVGLDASPDMIGQARQNYPRLTFKLENAATMTFESEFDAIFSNAALHWMLDANAVARNMARALRPGGRMVAELGGRGNIGKIERALKRLSPSLPEARKIYYFPALGEYTVLLESYGLEVTYAVLFDRPTRLEGEGGMEQWLRQFAFAYFETLEPRQQAEAIAKVVEALRPELWDGSNWTADYRRLRLTAVKL